MSRALSLCQQDIRCSISLLDIIKGIFRVMKAHILLLLLNSLDELRNKLIHYIIECYNKYYNEQYYQYNSTVKVIYTHITEHCS